MAGPALAVPAPVTASVTATAPAPSPRSTLVRMRMSIPHRRGVIHLPRQVPGPSIKRPGPAQPGNPRFAPATAPWGGRLPQQGDPAVHLAADVRRVAGDPEPVPGDQQVLA